MVPKDRILMSVRFGDIRDINKGFSPRIRELEFPYNDNLYSLFEKFAKTCPLKLLSIEN